MLEGYFVRTLGMHRVYNSAFMHMLRDEDNAGYRRVLKETLEFDPEILKRYVNFMNNPDEKTAVEQFGKGDKYFGVATLLATLPGPADVRPRPVRGLRREVRHGVPAGDAGRARRRVAGRPPRARDRAAAPPARRLRGGDATSCSTTSRTTSAASTRTCSRTRTAAARSRSLVVYHNRYGDTSGWIRDSAAYAVKDARRLEAARSGARWPRASASPTATRRRPLGRLPRAALRAGVPALRRRDPGARPPRPAARLRDARLLGAARAARQRRALAAAGRAARRAGACRRSRTRCATCSWDPCTTPSGRDRSRTPAREARRARVVDAVAEATGTAGDRGAVVDRIVGSCAAADAGRRGHRGPVAGRGAAASGRCWRRWARCPRGDGRADEPGLVRGAAAGTGRRRRAAPPRPRRGRGLVGRRARPARCWTCRCPRWCAARPMPCRSAWSTPGSRTRSCGRSCASTPGRASSWFHRESFEELLRVGGSRLEWILRPARRRARGRPIPSRCLPRSSRGDAVRFPRGPAARRLFVPGAEKPEPLATPEAKAEAVPDATAEPLVAAEPESGTEAAGGAGGRDGCRGRGGYRGRDGPGGHDGPGGSRARGGVRARTGSRARSGIRCGDG